MELCWEFSTSTQLRRAPTDDVTFGVYFFNAESGQTIPIIPQQSPTQASPSSALALPAPSCLWLL